MATKKPIGHVACPVCDFPDAQVKEDKNTHAYIHCGDCNAQTFTRNEHRNGKLRARMRPVTVTVPEPPAVPVVAPAPAPAPKAAAKAPAAPEAPPAAAKRPGFFTLQPLLAG